MGRGCYLALASAMGRMVPSETSFLQTGLCALSWPMPIRFTPVPLKARHDGWTADRQRRFIHVLAATKSLAKACAAVGMSRTSAYKLRDRPDALHFRLAWRAALE